MGSFYAFLLCLFIIGCGLVFLETAANPYVTELGAKETATSRLNLSQSFNGLGSLFATCYLIAQECQESEDKHTMMLEEFADVGTIRLVFFRLLMLDFWQVDT